MTDPFPGTEPRDPCGCPKGEGHRCEPNFTYPRTVTVACVTCGEPRTIRAWHPRDITSAETRSCPPCCNRLAQQHLDEMAVQRLLAGQPVRSTAAERAAAVAELTRHRQPAWVIAERLHVTKRTVERLRARI